MTDIFLGLLFLFILLMMVWSICYVFTDRKEQKKLAEEMYEELQRRDEERKKLKEKEAEANEQKKEMRTGTTTDQFNSSIDIMQKLSRKDCN